MSVPWRGTGTKSAHHEDTRAPAPRRTARRLMSVRHGVQNAKRVGVVVVDDQPLARMGLRAMLASHRDMRFLGEAESLANAMGDLERLRPDVVLVDAAMAGGANAAALRAVLCSVPWARVLALGVRDGDEEIFQMLEAGAAGYLRKTAPIQEIIEAIRQTHAGGRYLSAGARAQLEERDRWPVLTARQRDVVALLAEGRTNAAIAAVLDIAPGTVKLHVKSILAKLGVEDRAEAAVVALRRGFARIS